MKTYYVRRQEVHAAKLRVVADSEEDALKKLSEGEYTCLDSEFVEAIDGSEEFETGD